MNLEQRLARLEAQNRFLRRIILVTVSTLGMAMLIGAGGPRKLDPIQTSKLELVDNNGTVRARLTLEGTPRLEFLQEDGKTRTTQLTQYALDFMEGKDKEVLRTELAARQLVLNDENGKTRASLSLPWADGKTTSSLLYFTGPTGEVYLSEGGSGPLLSFYANPGHELRAQLGATSSQTYLSLSEKGGSEFFRAGAR
jgi:hypothetical protein